MRRPQEGLTPANILQKRKFWVTRKQIEIYGLHFERFKIFCRFTLLLLFFSPIPTKRCSAAILPASTQINLLLQQEGVKVYQIYFKPDSGCQNFTVYQIYFQPRLSVILNISEANLDCKLVSQETSHQLVLPLKLNAVAQKYIFWGPVDWGLFGQICWSEIWKLFILPCYYWATCQDEIII